MVAQASSRWSPAPPHARGTGALQVATCPLCGLERPIGLMVPDGGDACADLRWYCKDTRSCTQRWTSRSQEPAAQDRSQEPAAAVADEPAEVARDEPERVEVAAEQPA